MAEAVPLTNPVRHYAWGSRTVLPALLGDAVPAPEPWAEIWMGAHADDPSRLPDGRSLAEVEPDLPFLVKLLAAEEPLSIQVHPNLEQARAGLRSEAAAGVADRSYRDDNHKPELLVALTTVEALCGFRDRAEILALADQLRSPRWSDLVAGLRAEPSPAGLLGATFGAVVSITGADRAALLSEVLDAAAVLEASAGPDASARTAAAWALRLAARHHDDPGVLAPFLLRLVTLEPGEGLFVGAGVLHSYLHGAGVEVQASSDNVLRAGLTAKKVDLAELLRVVVSSADPARLVSPRGVASGLDAYDVPVADFAVWRVRAEGRPLHLAAPGPRIAVCTDGSVDVCGVRLTPGRAVYVPAGVAEVEVGGTGTCFVTAAGRTAGQGGPGQLG